MKILIIDDDTIVCSSLKLIVESSNHEVCATGNSGREAIELYKVHHPDIVLMDIRMDDLNGVDASKEILAIDPNAKILFLTTFEDESYLQEALALGVRAYLLKQDFDKLPSALEAVANGHSVYNARILTNIGNVSNKPVNPLVDDLSEKELEVIQLVASGLNNKEIADTLFLSDGSVRNLLSSILSKLDLRDRTQLAIFYYQNIK